MESPDSSDDDGARKWEESSQESDQSDELERVRDRFKKSGAKSFNFDKDFRY